MHLIGEGVGGLDGLGQAVRRGGAAEHAPAAGDERAVSERRARDEDMGAHGLGDLEGEALFIVLGIAAGGEDHAAGVFVAELDLHLV